MKNILFLGGDKRSITAYKSLKKSGYSVESKGLFTDDRGNIGKADIIVLPIPTTRDGETVYCPLTEVKIKLDDVKKAAAGKMVITAGYSFGENTEDIMKLDGFAYLNAVPTAEGAIAYAIDNTPFTLWKSRVLVIGAGRVAMVLADRLSSLGCKLTVSARKFKDFALLDTQSTDYMNTADVAASADKFDIIFNTVDVLLFSNVNLLEKTMLIDLSSKGCIDFEAAKEAGINAVKLPGLPGKVAPETAGRIYAKTLESVINLQN